MKQLMISLAALFLFSAVAQAQQPELPSNTYVTESVIIQDAQESPSDATSVIEPTPADATMVASGDCCWGRTRMVRRNNCCDPCARRGFFGRFGGRFR